MIEGGNVGGLARCCAWSLGAEAAEGHLFLMKHNGGVRPTLARLHQLESASDAVMTALGQRAIPSQALWSTEGNSATRLEAINDDIAFLSGQTHEFGEEVGPWVPEDAPEALAEMLSAFIDTLSPTPKTDLWG
eukprot:gene4975-6063_t